MFHILPKVRIQRKAKSAARKSQDWTKLFLSLTRFQIDFFGMGGRTDLDRSRVQLNDVRADNLRLEQELTRLRTAKLSNDIVLGDLKIEEKKHELRALGVIDHDDNQDPHY